MKKILLLIFFLIQSMAKINNVAMYSTRNLLNKLLINDNRMPSVYINDNNKLNDMNNINDKKIYSIEHIFPKCFLSKKDANDMHNTLRTHNYINNVRSNYAYIDTIDNKDEWIKLPYNNYLNHKKKLFIPNNSSKGFISRSIMYMSYTYGYDFKKIISEEDLYKWYREYPPLECEKYHNNIAFRYQNKDNIFISKYDKNNFNRNLNFLF